MADRWDGERDFQRYLAAKHTVDERAIDRETFERLQTELDAMDAIAILEVGPGIGAMIERVLALDALPPEIDYTAVDTSAANIDSAIDRLPGRLEAHGYTVTRTETGLHVERGARTASIGLHVDDALDFVGHEPTRDRSWDLIVGHAVLDVIDLEGLPTLLSAVPGGLCYFPITFDGVTRFSPAAPLDQQVEHRYHQHLDEKPDGRSRAGQLTLDRLHRAETEVLAVGGSDWIVSPQEDGYPADEAYFLHYIVDTIRQALAGDDTLDDDGLDEWTATRHRQIEAETLTYVTHQLDVLGRVPPSLSD